MGLVIAPDDFKDTIKGSYTASEWATAESNDGLVFLPAAGCRYGENGNTVIKDAGNIGFYWSASSYYEVSACDLEFLSDYVNPSAYNNRRWAMTLRLVTDMTE